MCDAACLPPNQNVAVHPNGLFGISEDENPPKGAMQPNVKSAGTYTKSRNLRAIHSLQGESALRSGAFYLSRMDHADLSTCIHKEVRTIVTVMHIKEVTRVGGIDRRHLSPLVTSLPV